MSNTEIDPGAPGEHAPAAATPDAAPDAAPPGAGLLLGVLVLGAVVANINLNVANVALPSIGRDLGATQAQQALVASSFALGLASSVLYLGGIGDRYGRRRMMILGAALSVPTALLAAYAPNTTVLVVARLLGGVAAGMLFPTTLSIITALWRGRPRTGAIAIWSGIGGGMAAVGPIIAAVLLQRFWWGSVFLFTIPLAVLVVVLAFIVVPARTGEETGRVDHLGGILSVLGVLALVGTVQVVPRGISTWLIVLVSVAVVALGLLFLRESRAGHPLIDLRAASAPTFWVAAVAGVISFGALVGAVFVGQQFAQNVLGYSPVASALASLPLPVMFALMSQPAGRLVLRIGSRPVFTAGLLVVAVGFLIVLLTWRASTPLAWVLIGYGVLGAGVAFAATPAVRSLMASLPVSRTGMGSAFVDLTRDLGGAIFQALMGSLLAAVYAGYFARAFASLPADEAAQLGNDAAQQIASSYAGAQEVAGGFPPATASEIINAAARAFTEGKGAAMTVGMTMAVLAAALVWWRYPRREQEEAFFARMAAPESAPPSLQSGAMIK